MFCRDIMPLVIVVREILTIQQTFGGRYPQGLRVFSVGWDKISTGGQLAQVWQMDRLDVKFKEDIFQVH